MFRTERKSNLTFQCNSKFCLIVYGPFLLPQFGFIAYENEEGKNLFFHMSEVEGEVELQASLQ